MTQVSGPQWAADPYGRYELRFWDGTAWTEHVSRHGVQARDPLAPVAPVVPEQTFGQEPFADLLPRSPGRAAGVPGHTRSGGAGQKAPRSKALPALLAAGAVAVVVALAASLGGGPSTPTASGTTDSIQPLAAVPTQTTKAKAATPAATATSQTTTKAAAKRTSKTTTSTKATTASARPKTSTKPKASTTKPRTSTSTRPKATSSTTAYRRYPNCDAMNVDYAHGVGRPGAKDSTSGKPVTTFVVNAGLYNANVARDGDDDGIACEKR
ncbi:DUF2510 domain-containing protein [Kineosporia sp. A_224]|uniref:DUF2510 domain-containing protein n=1 Tax=Kineosporia sp. A_224 TaxID=1962180 RepID=UPI000B4A83BF|nr:DUF2510 domain-containing protein [Kineosporia sp. A_224]